jgi:hypothetical protein
LFISSLHGQGLDTERNAVDSNVYLFTIKKYIQKRQIKNCLFIEFKAQNSAGKLPDSIEGVKTIYFSTVAPSKKYTENYTKISTLRLENGQFKISMSEGKARKINWCQTEFHPSYIGFDIYFEFDKNSGFLKYKSCRVVGCINFTEYTD